MSIGGTSRRATLRIVMERALDDFMAQAQAAFVHDLAIIAGCPDDEIEDIAIHAGCVRFEARLDQAAVERLVEMFQGRNRDTDSSEYRAFLEFLAEHQVTNITAEYEIKLQIVEKVPDDRHIVLVHGWRGDGDSFGNLPDYLEDILECPASVYTYPTGWLAHSPSLIFISRNLDNWIRNNIDARRIAFVAHSFGGLVVRKFVVTQAHRKAPLDSRVRQITLVASPHDGAVLAGLGKHVNGLGSAQVTELAPNSPVLFELNSLWQQWVTNTVPQNCQVRCIVGTADAMVSANGAQGLDPDAVPILGATHTNIVDISNPESEVVQTIVRFLEEAHFTKGRPFPGIETTEGTTVRRGRSGSAG